MIDAEILATPPFNSDEEAPLWLYTKWIPRGGDDARFALEVVASYYAQMSVQVYHKNYNESGDGTAYGPMTNITLGPGTGRTVQEWVGLKLT